MARLGRRTRGHRPARRRLRLEHRHYVKLTNTERGRNLATLGEEVFRQLSTDDDFFRQFDDSVVPD